eukprot:jgi/Mesen1/6718/ME000344S06002
MSTSARMETGACPLGQSLVGITRFRLRLIVLHVLFGLLMSSSACASAWNNKKAVVFPLKHAHFNSSLALGDSSGVRRSLFGEARMWLYGDVLSRGYYYANIWMGTPAQRFALIVDTGSTVTYVPCSTCTHCGSHQDSPYVPAASSTYEAVSCEAELCPLCDIEERCVYTRHYAEESSSSGTLASDVVGFGDASSLVGQRILFGCEMKETGDLFTQKADGIVGLGRGPLGLVDQLHGGGGMADEFSLCYGGMDGGGGAMILGKTQLPEDMVSTPLDTDRRLKDLHQVDGPDAKYHDICYGGAGTDESKLSRFFPAVSFVFGGGAPYHLSPENYLFKHREVEGAYCLGFFKNVDEGTLLGAPHAHPAHAQSSQRDKESKRARGLGAAGVLQLPLQLTSCNTLYDFLPEDDDGHRAQSSENATTPPTAPPPSTAAVAQSLTPLQNAPPAQPPSAGSLAAAPLYPPPVLASTGPLLPPPPPPAAPAPLPVPSPPPPASPNVTQKDGDDDGKGLGWAFARLGCEAPN